MGKEVKLVENGWEKEFGENLEEDRNEKPETEGKLDRSENARVLWRSQPQEWANKGSVAHLHAKTNPMNLIWSDSEQ